MALTKMVKQIEIKSDGDVFHELFRWEECVAKDIIEAIDEEKKSVTFNEIEGVCHLSRNLVTWSFEYEKLNEDVPDPNTFMDFLLNLTKDIETRHLGTPKADAH